MLEINLGKIGRDRNYNDLSALLPLGGLFEVSRIFCCTNMSKGSHLKFMILLLNVYEVLKIHFPIAFLAITF